MSAMARFLLTGATGTIGQAVVHALRARGEDVVALSRDPERARGVLGPDVEHHAWRDPQHELPPAAALAGTAAVIHLLGEPVAQRWNASVKRAIHDSRVLCTQKLVEGLAALPDGARPSVLVSQSATGYYGPRGDEPLTEDAAAGSDFLAGVVVEWERAAAGARGLTRVVSTRTGVVLSASGGALGKMLPFFRLGLGGPVAGGRQYVPWIHLEDVVGGLLHAADTAALEGALNLTAPAPVTNRELTRALAHALRRPAVFPVPAAALRLLYGEMAQIVVTGQRAVPAKLEQSGHAFRYPELEPALRDLL
jgi:uncharacterized protein (TIGR01777 family)